MVRSHLQGNLKGCLWEVSTWEAELPATGKILGAKGNWLGGGSVLLSPHLVCPPRAIKFSHRNQWTTLDLLVFSYGGI